MSSANAPIEPNVYWYQPVATPNKTRDDLLKDYPEYSTAADRQTKLQEAKEREIELCHTIEIQKKDICILTKDLEFIKLQRDTDRQIFDLQLRLAKG